MKTKLLLAAAFILTAVFSTQNNYAQSVQPQPAVYQQKIVSAALLFMENKGQVADDKGNLQPNILFTATSGGAKVYLTATGIHYQFSKTDYPKGYDPSSKHLQKDEKQQEELRKQIKTSTHRFSVELQGANLQPTVSKHGQSEYTENYYLSQCPNGITGVHGYERLTFKNVYPNIDWVVYSKGGFMEYDFLVHPGGNPASIKLKIKDADAVSITPQGELLIKTSLGEVREKAPVSYADGNIIASHFKQNGDGTIGFDVQPQPGKELRIDPSIVWSTYYGGSEVEDEYATTVDDSSNVYMIGVTSSSSNIASGGFQNTTGFGQPAFVVKFDSIGNRIWGTYYGGNSINEGYSCIVKNNFLYFCGKTSSTNLIAQNGFQNTYGGGGDAFLVKFNLNGARIWGSYYGGSGADYAYSCSVDNNNNVFLAGHTTSATGIASNGYQNSLGGGQDAFLVKFDASGNRLWATYLGGAGTEYGYACTTDTSNNVFLAGKTNSSTGIAQNGYQNTFGGGEDAFLTKFNGNGNVIWSTYLGGNSTDGAYSCTVDNNKNIYIAGVAQSTSGIAFNGFQNVSGGNIDAFLSKYSSSGSLLWSTYYGGTGEEGIFTSCASDNFGNIFLAGYTSSSTKIASNGFQNTFGGGGYDAFIAKFGANGNLFWGSYYGGLSSQYAFSVSYDKSGYLYVGGNAGYTLGLPVNGFQNTYGGGSLDAFLTRIQIGSNPISLCPNGSTTITSPITGSTYQWEMSQDGITWVNVPGAISQTLSLINLPSSSYGYQYRCKVNGTTYIDPYQLQFQNQWIGSTNSAWENPANWNCGVVPDGNTDVIINSGPVVLSSNGICRTLTVRPGVSFTVTTGNTLTITH